MKNKIPQKLSKYPTEKLGLHTDTKLHFLHYRQNRRFHLQGFTLFWIPNLHKSLLSALKALNKRQSSAELTYAITCVKTYMKMIKEYGLIR
jgi:hypothetical protein